MGTGDRTRALIEELEDKVSIDRAVERIVPIDLMVGGRDNWEGKSNKVAPSAPKPFALPDKSHGNRRVPASSKFSCNSLSRSAVISANRCVWLSGSTESTAETIGESGTILTTCCVGLGIS